MDFGFEDIPQMLLFGCGCLLVGVLILGVLITLGAVALF